MFAKHLGLILGSSTYFEFLFAFTNANLHEDGVFVYTHAADRKTSRSIQNWAHTKEFYAAKGWFGMNDLDLQLPTNLYDLVNHLCPHPFLLLHFFLSFLYS